jgi:hypothetical protein
MRIFQGQGIRQRDLRSYPLHLFEQLDLRVALPGNFLHPCVVFLDALVVRGCAAWHVNVPGLQHEPKNTYLSAQFRRLAARRGSKRAIIAVAHSLIIIGYYLQKNQRNYVDLGGDYFDRIDSDGLKRYLIRRLEKLGHKVTLVPIEAA